MKKLTFVTVILLCSLLFSSCASIFTNTMSSLSVNSNPQGAKLTIVNKSGKEIYKGVTPATISVKPSAGYMSGEVLTLTLSHEGYVDQIIYVTSKIEGWYWANIALGGLIGMLIIDPLTGAMYKLETEHVSVNLIEEKQSKDLTLNIIDINTLSEEQKKNLVKLN